MSSLVTSILSTLKGVALIALCAVAVTRLVSRRRPGADDDSSNPSLPPCTLLSRRKPPLLPLPFTPPPCSRPSPTLTSLISMTLADRHSHRSLLLLPSPPAAAAAPTTPPLALKKKQKQKQKQKKSVRIDLARNTLHTFPPNDRQFGVHWHPDKTWVVYHHELDPAGYDTLLAGRTRYPRDNVPDDGDLDDDGDVGMGG
ncbi:MAG: hypothetical protein Q9207_008402 [Kuettlingeria erythrocarpa]